MSTVANLKGLKIGWRLAAARRNPANSRKCPVCGLSFLRRGMRKQHSISVCCSRGCSAMLRRLVLIDGFNRKPRTGPLCICKTCGKQFQCPPSQRAKYCSMACRATDRTSFDSIRGARHYNWKNGVTPENQRLRSSLEYRAWTMAIFRRDCFSCQWCKAKRVLNAHHLFPWALFPELRFTVSNGITLCLSCHRTLHKLGRHLTSQINESLRNYDDSRES